MRDWFAWQQFPDFQRDGYPEASDGPGVYELRHRSTGKHILFGRSKNVARRMKSLLPKSHGGHGTRNNLRKREYVAEHLPDVEYRTRDCATEDEAKELERRLKYEHTYVFHERGRNTD